MTIPPFGIAATAFALPKSGVHFTGVFAIRVPPRSPSRGRRNTPKYRYSYYRGTLSGGKDGIGLLSGAKPPFPEERGRTDITRGLWNFVYWETTRDSADYDKWPGNFCASRRPLIDAAARIQVHREEKSPRRAASSIRHAQRQCVKYVSITNEKLLVESFSRVYIPSRCPEFILLILT